MAAALIGAEPAPGAACQACGRRFPAVVTPERCSICGSRELTAIELGDDGVILAWTRVHRGRPSSLFPVPYQVVHVRELAGGDYAASFNCPLLGDRGAPAIGDRVAVQLARWELENGETFAGLVACQR